MSQYDSPWKEALERFLRAFLEFFFPEMFARIDWSRGYEGPPALVTSPIGSPRE